MTLINVTVTVDTEIVTQENLKTSVVLTDDHGDHNEKPGDSETFTIEAAASDKVHFIPVAKDGQTRVQFNNFKWENIEGTQHCFDPLPFVNNDWTGTVVGEEGDHENFSITFTVQGKGKFTLDPKLRVGTGG